jgi:hypothetical protein
MQLILPFEFSLMLQSFLIFLLSTYRYRIYPLMVPTSILLQLGSAG